MPSHRRHASAWTRLQGTGLLVVALLPARPAQAWSPPLHCAVQAGDDAYCAPVAEGPMVLSTDGAADLLRQVSALRDQGQHRGLIEAYRAIEQTVPTVADRFAVERAELHLHLGEAELALSAFQLAARSLDPSTRIRGEIGIVRTELFVGTPGARSALSALVAKYPALPRAAELELLWAKTTLRQQRVAEALAILRGIDLSNPGSAVAEEARRLIDGLAAQGFASTPYSLAERLGRTERLAQTGPLPAARADAEALMQNVTEPQPRAKLLGILSRIARAQGRTDEADRYDEALATLQADVALSDSAPRAQAPRATSADAARAAETVRARLRGLVRSRSLHRVRTSELVDAIALGARVGAAPELGQLLGALGVRPRISANVKLTAAIWAIGSAPDGAIEPLLRSLLATGEALAARFHLARTLERMGRTADALQAYRGVIADSERTSPTASAIDRRYYRMWAGLRIAQLTAAALPDRGPWEADPDDGKSSAGTAGPSTSNRPAANDRAATRTQPSAAPMGRAERASLAARLDAAIVRVGADYPWIGRAKELILVGALPLAADELFEAYRQHRLAKGQRVSPVLEVAYGARPLPQRHPLRLRPARGLRSPSPARAPLPGAVMPLLGSVARSLGDEGTAISLAGYETGAPPGTESGARPRPYAAELQRAATEHGVDPHLLFAVMRVESVYQRRAVSYAGALGLMQIMPRTGRLIATRLDEHDFDVAALLDPATNLRFAAWYLASLIQRFDGRLPLAIAAYNAGPHNVRKWLRMHPTTMPLDAFLETIPFGQTHGYVRKVLGHYAAYRADSGLPPVPLDTEVPNPGADAIAF